MPKKLRSPIPDYVAAEVLFLHDRTCCVCHIKGRKIQIHHLDEDPSNNDPDDEDAAWSRPNQRRFKLFVEHLPNAAAAAYEAARPEWEGSNLQMIDGSNLVIDTLKRLWLGLSEWFPPSHFGPTAGEYLDKYIDERWQWHYALSFAGGDPGAGSSFAVFASDGVIKDVELMILQTVRSLAYLLDKFDLNVWERRWAKATDGTPDCRPTQRYDEDN
jgi:hypothetical protein